MAKLAPYLQLLPVFIIFSVVFGYPWFTALYLSLTSWNPAMGPFTPRLVGLANYETIFTDPLFYRSLQNTFILMLGLVFVMLPLGLGVALLLNRELKAERLIVTGLLIPTLISPAVAGLVWKLFTYSEIGLFNWILRDVGLQPVNWTSSYPLSILIVFLVNMWLELPFVSVVLLAGLKAIPGDQFDVAQIDGASRFQVFRYITVPNLLPMIAIVLIFETFFVIRTFDVVFVLIGSTGGSGSQASVLGTYMYFSAFRTFDLGLGSAISIVMFLIALIITGGLLYSIRKELIL